MQPAALAAGVGAAAAAAAGAAEQQQQKKKEAKKKSNSNMTTYFGPALVHWYVLQYRPVSFLCFDCIRPCDFVDVTFVLQAGQ